MSIATTLWKIQTRRWLTKRGFIGVLAVTALPLLLTGAWLMTHTDDVVGSEITWTPESPQAGDVVNITATILNDADKTADPFKATLRVGFVEERFDGTRPFNSLTTNTTQITDLGPGESTQLHLTWVAQPGTFRFDLQVDQDDDLAEIEELNNDRFQQVFIEPRPAQFPPVRGLGNDSADQSVDLEILSMSFPDAIYSGNEANITIQVANHGPADINDGNVIMQAIIPPTEEQQQATEADLSKPLMLAAGEETEVRFTWEPQQVSRYALVALADPGQEAREETPGDNANLQLVFVDRQVIFEEPEEKATIKEFFSQVISGLQVRIVIPLLALFYAAGVLADPKRGGELVYLLTRPVPRWALPLTRFTTSFVVAFLAIVVGSLLSFLALLQSPESSVGLLTGPLSISVMALFSYTAIFTFIGVVTDHPYLWGLGFVVGWETFAGFLLPWVQNLTLNHHLTLIFQGMELDQGAVWFPQSAEGASAAWRLLLIGFFALLASAAVMTKREFRLD